MKLRTRLVVVTILVIVPMVATLSWLDVRSRHRAAAFLLSELVSQRLQLPDERARCEADPAAWGAMRRPGRPMVATSWSSAGGPPPHGVPFEPPRGPPPGPPPRHLRMTMPSGAMPVHYVYDDALVSTNRAAPSMSRDDVRDLEEGELRVLPQGFYSEDVDVLARTPWGQGPCAYVLTHGTTTPGFVGALLPSSPIWLAPLAAVMIAILIAVGPVVARLRRLTLAVARSAERGFIDEVPVEGRDEVKELAVAFGAASREVRAQLAAKDLRERSLRDFLSNTTHDVMIPLTVLKAHLTTLLGAYREGQLSDLAVLTGAMDEAHYIGALLHNLAVAAKLDAGEPVSLSDGVDLGALVLRIVGRHAPIARQRRIVLEHAVPEQPLTTRADVTMLEQAVSNIVYNAIRHNPTGGHVAVTLESISDERFRIRVLDDGPGIPATELARLLERGQRGDDARTRAPEGRGLGLDIVQRDLRSRERGRVVDPLRTDHGFRPRAARDAHERDHDEQPHETALSRAPGEVRGPSRSTCSPPNSDGPKRSS
jgi:two-component system, OmpR family, sensor histidine kinase BaeS